MSKASKKVVRYDYVQQKWYMKHSSPIGEKPIKNLYWGAQKVRFPVHIFKKKAPASSTQIKTCAHIEHQPSKLILGPLIGILTVSGERYPFSGLKQNFIDIIRTGRRKGGIVFVFTPEGMDWQEKRILGYLYHSKRKEWRKAIFPFPNVVYNRIPRRNDEQTMAALHTISHLQNIEGVTLYNPHFFNKQELFQILERSPALVRYLPATQAVDSKRDVQRMLKQHKQVYLKPIAGKAGAGIIRAEYEPTRRRFTTYFYKKKTLKMAKTQSFSKLWALINKHMTPSGYIIQKAVPLAVIDQSPFDFRVLVQKNGQGMWQVSGVGSRVAGNNRITTHVPRGGRIESPTDVLAQAFPAGKGEKILANVHKLALSIAHELEAHYTHLGEMSIDIGVDQDGELWFFEANAKPMKFDEPDIRKASLANIIAYAKHLTFHQPQRENTVDANR